MSVLKKILLFITIIIFLFILWNLIFIRISLKKQMNEDNKENFSIMSIFGSTQQKEVIKSTNSSKVTIENISRYETIDSSINILELPLKDFCVKASFNSAISGNFVSLDMLQYVINRGVRYLDFEVFYIEDVSHNFIPVVAASTDPNFIVLSTENYILLDKVLGAAVANAFSSPCPNYSDPLFINLRIKSKNTNVYDAVGSSVDNNIQQKICVDSKTSVISNLELGKTIFTAKTVTNDTKIKEILNSVVLSVDKTIFPNYLNESYTKCPINGKNDTSKHCYYLKNYINIQNGSEDMNLILYSYLSPRIPFQISDDNIRTDAQTITVLNPDNLYLMNSSNGNLDYGDCILKYGCQIVPYRFYHYDDALEDYEDFFNMNRSGIVPLANAISYYMNSKNKKLEGLIK